MGWSVKERRNLEGNKGRRNASEGEKEKEQLSFLSSHSLQFSCFLFYVFVTFFLVCVVMFVVCVCIFGRLKRIWFENDKLGSETRGHDPQPVEVTAT